MKKVIYLIAFAAMLFVACSPMDDNYSEYIERKTTYAAKVTIDDVAYMSIPEDGSITLYWHLPINDRLENVEIIRKESSQEGDTIQVGLVEEYTFTDLETQSHDFAIYTIDKFGNRSIPTSVTLIPLQDRNGTAEKPYPVSVATSEYMSIPEDGSISLYWTLPTQNSNIKDVEVICKVNEIPIDTINAGVTDMCTFTELNTSDAYDFYISVINNYSNSSDTVILSSLKAVKGSNGTAEREETEEENQENQEATEENDNK